MVFLMLKVVKLCNKRKLCEKKRFWRPAKIEFRGLVNADKTHAHAHRAVTFSVIIIFYAFSFFASKEK
jgi:hypothetical protein